MDHILPILSLFVGLAIGGGAVWLLLRAKTQHAYDRGKADGEAERIALSERLNARDQTIGGLNGKVQELERQIAEHHAAESKLHAKVAQLATTLDQERKQAEEKLAVAEGRAAEAVRRLQGPGRRSPEEQQPVVPRLANDLRNSRKRPRATWKNANRRSGMSSRSRNRWTRWTPRSASWKRPGPGPTAA